MIAPAQNDRQDSGRGVWPVAGVGVAALAAGVIVGRYWPAEFFHAYLVVWLFLWNLALGSLALVMIHHLTGGAWGLVVRRPLEAQMTTLPLVALLFIPIALGSQLIFPWSRSQAGTTNPDGTLQTIYFRPEFVWGRAIVCFAIWTALGWLLSAWSRQEDRRGGALPAFKSHSLSGPGLVLYGVTLHFVSIDWMMSLAPSFNSTIFGPIVAACQLVSAFALALIVFAWASDRAVYQELISTKLLLDLGNLLFTLVVVWAYLVWCQFMLIWIGDLPHDNIWWLARSRGAWLWIAGVIVLFHLVVPFFLLLFRAVKQRRHWLGSIAALVLAMQFVFVNYQVWPESAMQPAAGLSIELLLAIGLGGLWLASFLWLIDERPLVPLHDRNLPHAQKLWSHDQAEAARQEAIAHG